MKVIQILQVLFILGLPTIWVLLIDSKGFWFVILLKMIHYNPKKWVLRLTYLEALIAQITDLGLAFNLL